MATGETRLLEFAVGGILVGLLGEQQKALHCNRRSQRGRFSPSGLLGAATLFIIRFLVDSGRSKMIEPLAAE